MAQTATKDRVDEETLVDAAARAAEELQAKSLATIRPDQQRWDEHQLAILRQLGVEDAPQGDLDLFFHYCRTTGLDPFRKQIYMIGRNTKLTEWVPVDPSEPDGRKRKVERWVTKYTIQTGIDGYRRNGREAAKILGDTLRFDGPYWCGEDGQWREVWPAKEAPTAAKFVIFRNGEPFSAIAHYDEFVQTNNIYDGEGQNRKIVGQEPNSMWAKMPRNQIAKCFDPETEVLTTNGYMRFAEVGEADRILQVTPSGLEPVDSRPFRHEYTGPMIAMHGDMLDFTVTPNHDMVTNHGKIEAGALHALATAKSAVRVPMTAPGRPVDRPGITDAALQLLGYVIADASEAGNYYKIAVSRPYKIAALDEMHPDSRAIRHSRGDEARTESRTVRTNFDKMVYGFHRDRFNLPLGSGKTINVDYLMSLSQRQARIVIDAWQQFDGHTDGRSGVRRLFTSRTDHLAAAELLATLAGYSVNVPRKRFSDISDRPGYVLTISEPAPIAVTRRSGQRPQIVAEPDNPSGEVWCVTVPSGRIMVRRRGFAMVCGNCAEALAWRRAYPDDFSGLILEDAAQPIVIDPDGNIESDQPRTHRPGGAGINGVRAARERREAQRQSTVIDADGGSNETLTNWSADERRKGLNRMHQLFGKARLPKDARDDRLTVTSSLIDRKIASSNDLTDDEIARTNNQLDKWEKAGQLADKVADILDQAALDAAQAADQAKSEAQQGGKQE